MIDKTGITATPVAKDGSKDVIDVKAVTGMVSKLADLQELASRNGFNFLAYMLDIARVEAESLRDQQKHQKPPSD